MKLSSLSSITYLDSQSLLKAVILGIILSLVLAYSIIQSYKIYSYEEEQRLENQLANIERGIKDFYQSSRLETYTLSFAINEEGEIGFFDSIASGIMSANKILYGLQLEPGGVISHVYPYKEHREVIGIDIFADNPRLSQQIENDNLYFSGPFMLTQGMIGIVGRYPVYRKGEFWGYSCNIIKFDDFVRSVLKTVGGNDYMIQFSRLDKKSGKESFFIRSGQDYHLQIRKEIPETDWVVYVGKNYSKFFKFSIIAASFSSLIAVVFLVVFFYRLFNQPKSLKKTIDIRTRDLKIQKANYQAVVQSIPDLLFVIDYDGYFKKTFDQDSELLMDDPSNFLDKNIKEVFNHKLAAEIQAHIKSIEEGWQSLIKHSYNLTIEGKEYDFEARYVPYTGRNVLILVRNVTVENRFLHILEKSEAKYKNLVQQATDGIFNCKLDGQIIEFNNEFCRMLKSPDTDIHGRNINDLVKLEDHMTASLTQILLKEGKIMVEGNMSRAAKNSFPVEINCTLTKQNTVQGIVRNISKRKEYIRSIERQNEQLREIARIQSHEVREPLAKIMAILEFFERQQGYDKKLTSKLQKELYHSAIELDAKIKHVVDSTFIDSQV